MCRAAYKAVIALWMLEDHSAQAQPYADPLRHRRIVIEDGSLCPPAGWELVFAEDFNGDALDEAKWLTHYPYCVNWDDCFESRAHGWPEMLTINADSNVMMTGDGLLRILARKGDMAFWHGAFSVYTGGVLHSRMKFPRGRFECRLKVPRSEGKHLWPAFWLFGGGPECVEIDILEIMAKPSTDYHYALHRYNGPCDGKVASEDGNRTLRDLSDDFHVFRLDWSIWFVDWYIDDVLVARSSRISDLLNRPVTACYAPKGVYIQNQAFPAQEAEVSIILSLGVRGRLFNSVAGQDLDIPDLPATMEVDYVRVYRGL
ncbi:MAG TPA: glycoside hydrolase family 16 protein [Flavobacteriales bacterium]|nr:glycoside hydrolase family 16 protein [Flavobacteriales bacterium]